MISVRRSEERGHADHGWLDTRHTFSFDTYHDPNHMHFRHLRVINEDVVSGGKGFGMHPHKDMEIVTYIVSGALEHRDSMGNGSVIERGDVQKMSAGSGILHSEFNHSPTEPVHLLQIWIFPDKKGLTPGYQQRRYGDGEKRGRFCPIVTPDGRENSLKIAQDVNVYACLLDKGAELEYELGKNRHAWLQVITGELSLNDVQLSKGDGAAASDETKLRLASVQPNEFILFDLN